MAGAVKLTLGRARTDAGHGMRLSSNHTGLLTDGSAAGVFATWRAWSAERASQKQLVQRAVHRLVHHHLHAAFSSWRTASSRRSAERGLIIRAVMHMLNITKVSYMIGFARLQ